MDLDQYVYQNVTSDGKMLIEFEWRRNYLLHHFMEQLYAERVSPDMNKLNLGELELFLSDIKRLKRLVLGRLNSKSSGGFFVGYQSYDLQFCLWAEKVLKAGDRVFYTCWW